MPRRARLVAAGIPWHIIQRGNNRKPCFFRQDDYIFYLRTLEEQASRFECSVHAYCLMTNHIHILLTPEAAEGPSLLMKQLGQRYVQYVNARYTRSGTLWEGRYKSCLAQDDRYALCCYRYIELNPVRADIALTPGDYPWSSFHCNGLGKTCGLLSPHRDYLALGRSPAERCTNYRELVALGLSDDDVKKIRDATQGNHILGSAAFGRKLASELGRRVKRGKAGRPPM